MEQTAKPAEAPKPKGKKTWVAIAAAVVIIVVVVAALYFTGYLGGGGRGPTQQVTIFETPRGTCSTATNCDFPSPFSVSSGTTVTWVNNSTVPHTVTACSTTNAPSSTECPNMNASNLSSFDSGSAGISASPSPSTPGGTYSYKFSATGTYYYYCRFHSWMHGQINVS